MATGNSFTPPVQVTLASFGKKLIAWVYDLLGALAIFILSLVVGYLLVLIITLPWAENSEAVSALLSQNPLWLIYLAASVQYYYVWCWVKGGQTVGMKTWRLKLCKPDGSLLSWKEAYIRSFISLGGLAIFWSLFDSEKRGIHDIFCDSRVVLLPKDNKKQDKPLI